MIVENKPFSFMITHVEAEQRFLKIWAQTDDTIIQSVDAMLQNLQDSFEYYVPSNFCMSSIKPNVRCCARKNNAKFCRAVVLDLRTDSMVKIRFVDYGNTTLVPINNIRLLDSIRDANYLFSLPEAATAFVLADVMPIGDLWQDDIISRIHSILVYKKFHGIYQTINNIKTIKFSAFGEDFSQTLINRHMALYSSFSKQMKSPPVQPLQTHQANSISQDCNWRMPLTQNMPIQKIVKTKSIKAIQLEIGSVHDVQISYVEEGPCKFSVQLIESIPSLNAMMEKINSQPRVPLQEPPIAGAVCLGLQTSTNRLCRVVLNSPGDTSCKVYFADYGHHEVLPFSSIYQIPEEFISDVYSIRFTLSGIINWSVSQEMKDYFGGLVCDKILKLRVCKGPMSPLTQYCDLFINGKSVKDILSDNFPEQSKTYLEPKCLQKGAKEIVFVSYVISPVKFFVQIERDLRLLDKVMDEIERISKTAVNLSPAQMYVNMPCIALYHDNKWYRASIVNIIDNKKVKVFYVDYGNEEVVPISNLRAIPENLVKILPKQAITCSLRGFSSEFLNSELTKDFEKLVLEERLSLIVLNVSSNVNVVDLYDEENVTEAAGKNITEKLKEAILKHNVPNKSNESRQNSSFEPIHVRNESENWNAKQGKDSQLQKTSYPETSKTKFRKDNENEQRHDNRFRKIGSENPSGHQNNQFDKERTKLDRFNQNDRFGKGTDFSNTAGFKENLGNDRFSGSRFGNNENQANQLNSNARLDRSNVSDKSGSDRDSDISSRGSGRRNNRGGRRSADDQRKRVEKPPNNRQRMGRWENEEHENQRKNYNGDANMNSGNPKSPKNNMATFNKSKSSELDTSKLSTACNLRCLTSTPISKIPSPNITVGAIKKCTMVYYNNPSSFYVQLCPDNEELHSIMDRIDSLYKNGGKVFQPTEIKTDLQCIAQYSVDQQWYRAVVKKVESNGATVHFVDYGNVETVSFKKIKEIESEFLKLPAQAVHCKLFCPSKSNWNKNEIDSLSDTLYDKSLEAEFIAEENGVYQVLIKESKHNDQNSTYINDLFCNGVNLNQEKEAIRSKTKNIITSEKLSPNFAPLSEKWLDYQFELGTTEDVIVAWFINPQNFYCQLTSQQEEFRSMMNEIQNFYAEQQPVSGSLQIGSSVIAVLPDDGVLYRATILELNKSRGHVVQYVDYGDSAMVSPRKIYPVDQKFRKLPKQAFFCSLNVIPMSGSNSWTNSTELGEIFASKKFQCTFHEIKNEKYVITLMDSGTNVALTLVNNNLAAFPPLPSKKVINDDSKNLNEKQETSRIDINLLEGQTLYVKVSHVEGVSKFYVQFYTAEACQTIVDDFMDKKDPKMVGLPGQLAIMQNQAIECALFDVPLSSKANDLLKNTITGKDVKIFVEKVEFNRLVVRLFDTNGNKIKVVDSQNLERISPVCNMQILSSTHEVIVICMNNSSSVWLQRTVESPLAQQLLEAMYEYYSKSDNQVKVEENELYAALSYDGNWYRVQVIKVKETEATVTLIDYGNVEDIRLEDFRKLESQFYLPHRLAIEVSLTVKLSGNDETQRKILKPLLMDKNFTATFYNVNRKWIVELSENNEKISEKLSSLEVAKEAPKSQPQLHEKPIEDIEMPEMRVAEKYKVFISHVNNPNQLWLRIADREDALENLQCQLQEVAKSSLCPNYDGIPEEKSLCLAMYSFDHQWYRAEVIDADSDITTVLFIDYGNTDVVDNKTNGIKELPDKWKSIKRYAVQCKLDVLPASDLDDWSEEACSRISELINSQEPLEALIIADKAPMRIDLFMPNGQSICKMLIDEKLAVPAIPDSSELLIEPEEIAFTEELELDPRSAYVSNIISVDEFWLQEDKFVNDLEMVEDRLMMASLLPPVTDIKEGLICVAHYPPDNMYYRARIVSLSDDEKEKAKVHYIDYGNSGFSKDLRTIPEDLAQIKPLSRKCCLAKPDGVDVWPNGIDDEFIKLSGNGETTLLLDVIEEADPCIVRLTHNSKDVALELLELCAKRSSSLPPCETSNPSIAQSRSEGSTVAEVAETDDVTDAIAPVEEIATTLTLPSRSDERPPPIGEETTENSGICVVTHVNSPSEFWIQNTSQFPDIDLIADKMLNAEHFNTVTDIKVGKLLAAKFDEDNQWYRSKILSCGESGIEVFYIDYGNSALVASQTDLRELPDDLLQIPALCTCCSLKMPENCENWSIAACDKFIDLTDCGRTKLKFKILNENKQMDIEQPTEVELFYDNQDVVEILLNSENQDNINLDKNTSDESGIHSEGIEQHVVITNNLSSSSLDSANMLTESNINNSSNIVSDKPFSNTEIDKKAVTREEDEKIEKSDGFVEERVTIINKISAEFEDEKTIIIDNKESS